MELNEIASKARTLTPKEYNKDALYRLMRTCFDSTVLATEGTSIILDEASLEALFVAIYRHCDLPRSAKPKTPERWVHLAMPVNNPRRYLNYIYSDGKRIVATDGHRLHLYVTDKYEAGFYDAKMVKVTGPTNGPVGGKYPDFDRLINVSREAEVPFSDLKEIMADQETAAATPLPVYPLEHIHLNAKYLDEAMHPFSKRILRMSDNKYDSVMLQEGDYTALVMGMRK